MNIPLNAAYLDLLDAVVAAMGACQEETPAAIRAAAVVARRFEELRKEAAPEERAPLVMATATHVSAVARFAEMACLHWDDCSWDGEEVEDRMDDATGDEAGVVLRVLCDLGR